MAALCTVSFKGLTIRPANGPKDLKLATAWTAADPDHCKTTRPIFWLEQDFGIESYVMQDKRGAIFFFKLMRAPMGEIEVHIQFSPLPDDPTKRAEQKDRVMNALIQGFDWMKTVLALKGTKALFFVSRSPHLIRFSKRHLGFKAEGDRLVHTFPPPEEKKNHGEES